jgi:PST family polysaccharide transporter
MQLSTGDSEVFATAHLQRGLAKRSAQGLALGVGSQAIQVLATLTATIVLARLLAPEDFGLIAMASVITALISVVGDFGLSSAVIQRAKITHRQASTLFWINAAVGLAIALLMVAISPLVSLLYDESRLVWITMGQGGVLFLWNIGSQHSAILRRQMRFRSFTLINVTGSVVGLVTGIVAAANGAGYWALLLMPVATAVSTLILKFSIVGWMPGRPGWDSGTKEMLGFGANVTGSGFVHVVSRQLDNFLIGRFVGVASLGFYTKAYSLMIMPPRQVINPIQLVFIPALSSLKTHPERYREYYGLMVLGTSSLVIPFVFLFIVMAEPLVNVLLGDQWQPAARLFQYLAPAALFGTLGMLGTVFRSWGHVGSELKWTLGTAPVTIAGFLIGIIFGMEGVAISFSVTRVLLFYPSLRYGFRGTPLSVAHYHRSTWRPMAATIAASVVVLLITGLIDFSSDVRSISVALPAFALVYVAFWILIPGGRRLLADGIATMRSFRNQSLGDTSA